MIKESQSVHTTTTVAINEATTSQPTQPTSTALTPTTTPPAIIITDKNISLIEERVQATDPSKKPPGVATWCANEVFGLNLVI